MRLIFDLPPRTSVSERFIDLEILRVDQSVVFTCLVYVHKFFQNQVPDCIKNLLEVQSINDRLLKVKYYSSAQAKRSFSFCAPRYWNKLPLNIRLAVDTSGFKSLIKFALLENTNNIMSATTGYFFIPR